MTSKPLNNFVKSALNLSDTIPPFGDTVGTITEGNDSRLVTGLSNINYEDGLLTNTASSYPFASLATIGTDVIAGNNLSGVGAFSADITDGTITRDTCFNATLSSSVLTATSFTVWNAYTQAALSFWYKLDAKPTVDGMRIFSYGDTGPTIEFAIDTTTDYKLRYYLTAGGTLDISTVDPVFNDTRWHHVLVQMNSGSNIELYVDGVLQSVTGINNTISFSDASPALTEMSLGNVSGVELQQHMDSFSVYNKVLTTDERTTLATPIYATGMEVSVDRLSVNPDGSVSAPALGPAGSEGLRILFRDGSVTTPPVGIGLDMDVMWHSVPTGYSFLNYVQNSPISIIDANGVGVYGTNVLEFGVGVSKNVNAGKIGYGTFSSNVSIDIVGAGTAGTDRRVRIHDRLGVNKNPDNIGQLEVNCTSTTRGAAFFTQGNRNLYDTTSNVLSYPTLAIVSDARLATGANAGFDHDNLCIVLGSNSPGSGGNSSEMWGIGVQGSGGASALTFQRCERDKDIGGFNDFAEIARISSGGTTGSLNFTGQHRCCAQNDLELVVGYIVSSTGEYCISTTTEASETETSQVVIKTGEDAITINESLPIIAYSTINQDKKVFGVVSDKEVDGVGTRSYSVGVFTSVIDREPTDTRHIINSVGEGAIWVADINGSLENGDYITSTTLPGLGGKQADDLLHNYTVAKITMGCDFSGVGYKLKYVDAQGFDIPIEAYTVDGGYKSAFVGCTYHCG